MTMNEAIAALRDANEPVPKPFRLPTRAEVDAAEIVLGVEFHEDYRRFPLEASDVAVGTLEPFVVIPNAGRLDLVVNVIEAWKPEFSRGLLPICEDTGAFYCMSSCSDSSRVMYCEFGGAVLEEWPDFATWIEQVWWGKSVQ